MTREELTMRDPSVDDRLRADNATDADPQPDRRTEITLAPLPGPLAASPTPQ